jgi:integrase
MAEGIRVRHSRGCPKAAGGAKCSCKPVYEASVWSKRDRKKIRKTFATPAAARSWRRDTGKAVEENRMRAPRAVRFREFAEQWFRDVESGVVRARSGDPYKPSVIRSYRTSLTCRRTYGHPDLPKGTPGRSILDELGPRKLGDITREDLMAIVDDLVRLGLDGSTIRNSLMPLRVIYARAMEKGLVAVNPVDGLRLPAAKGRRDRIASTAEAAQLLAAVRDDDRAIWATAFYAGLRRGELAALTWRNVDFDRGMVKVEASWDEYAGVVPAKSKAGRREVPMIGPLRALLLEHLMRSGRPDDGAFVFAAESGKPFAFSGTRRRSLTDWKQANAKALAELEGTLGREPTEEEAAAVTLTPIGLHEARHTFASMAIAAGVNIKAVSTYMGHASITITLDRYGHLMPGHETEAVDRLDAYLAGTGAHSGAHPSPASSKPASLRAIGAD